MVEQTIQAIRETEAKAGAIVKDAEVQCKNILEDASQEARTHKADQLEKTLRKAESMMEDAKVQGTQTWQEAAATVENEIKVLKGLASEKEEAAVSLVISQLV